MSDSNKGNTGAKVVQIGQAVETDTALPITVARQSLQIGQAVEIDTALPIGRLAQQDIPSLLLQAVVIPGRDATHEGRLIEAVAFPWFTIIEMMQRDPNIIYQLHWRQWEEIIAGAYKRQGLMWS